MINEEKYNFHFGGGGIDFYHDMNYHRNDYQTVHELLDRTMVIYRREDLFKKNSWSFGRQLSFLTDDRCFVDQSGKTVGGIGESYDEEST